MRALILAAGRGSRMGSLTENQPKCRTMFRGKSLLQWQCEALNRAGIDDIALVRGYLKETFAEPLQYFDNSRWSQTNMVTSLCCANQWLEADNCIISYADIAYKPQIICALRDSSADIAIAYDINWLQLWRLRFEDPLSDAESFIMNDSGYITDIGRSVDDYEQIKGQYMGLLKFTPRGWAQTKSVIERLKVEQIDRLDMTSLLQLLLAQSIAIEAVPNSELWLEVDSAADLAAYESLSW